MSRPHDKSGKKRVEVERPSRPLQSNPFAMLGEIEVLKELPRPEPEKPKLAAVAPASTKPAKAKPVIALGEKPAPFRGRLILRREKKDRGGKTVVVIAGFKDLPEFNAVKVADLARDVKNKLGCGGSFDRHEIVLQGDRCGAVADVLEWMGFRVDGVKEDGPQQ